MLAGQKCLVAWSIVCFSCVLGALGLIDLRRFDIALWLRWVVSAKAKVLVVLAKAMCAA